MKTCLRCRTSNPDGLRFCTSCGHELCGGHHLDRYGTHESRGGSSLPDGERTVTQNLAYQHFLRAKTYIKQKNLRLAIREFECALEIHPHDPMVRRLLEKTREAHNRMLGRSRDPAGAAPLPVPPVAPGRGPPAAPDAASVRELMPPAPVASGTSPRHPVPGSRTARAPVLPTRRSAGPGSAGAVPGPDPRGRSAPDPGTMNPAAPLTGRLLESFPKTPAMSLALMLDDTEDGGYAEIAVSVLILLGLLAFSYVLFL